MSADHHYNHHHAHHGCVMSMADQIHAEVRSMIGHSRLVRKSEGIALIHRHDLHVKELLGKGAFSEVHEVKLIPRNNGHDIMSQEGNKTSYAMKHLKQRLLTQPDNFRLAAAELAIEAHMLASFDHPNIMKIRGWAANGVASFTDGRHDSFFLLLDKLDETLDQRITTWQKMQQQIQAMYAQAQAAAQQQRQGGGGNLVTDLWRRIAPSSGNSGDAMDVENVSPAVQNQQRPPIPMQQQHSQLQQAAAAASTQQMLQARHKHESLQLEKLGICVEIASALAYLHDSGVIFRDLKPNNIGFLNGRVQLFDFGLSRELPALNTTDPFEMSGKVGTLRYMAVEVACHQMYNVSADVYSWSMVCYEIFTLTKPFAGWTRDMHSNLVCGRGVRPELNDVQPAAVKPLLEASWDQHAFRRPTMHQAEQRMRQFEEQQLFTVCALDRSVSTDTRIAPSRSKSFHPGASLSQMRHAQQPHQHYPQHLLQHAHSDGDQVVELPQGFSVDVRKAPARNHSETYTAATLSMSADSLAEFMYP